MFFYGPSQRFDTTFNNPSSTYDLPPSSSCYRPSLPTQMRDINHEDDDNNNTNNNDDDHNSGEHILQQHTITRDHSRTRGGRGRRTRKQQTHTNPVQ